MTVDEQVQMRLRLGDLVVDGGRLLVEPAVGPPRSLPPKALAVLVELARQPGRTVSRSALMDAIWQDSFPTPDALTHAVKELRRALDDDPREPRFIETVPRVGYRLMVPVAEADATIAAAMPADPVACEPGPQAPPAATAAMSTQATPLRRRPRQRWLAMMAAGLLGALGVAAAMLLAEAPQDEAEPVPMLQPLTTDFGLDESSALAPDGGAIAFIDTGSGGRDLRVFLRVAGAAVPVQLANADAAADADSTIVEVAPAWSNDGRQLAFARYLGDGIERCRIIVVNVATRVERDIGPCPMPRFQRVSWSHDDRALVLSVPTDEGRGRVLAQMRIDGSGVTAYRYPREEGDVDVAPRMSPDGQWLAFRRGVNPYSDVYAVRVDGSELTQLTRWGLAISELAWMPDSRHLLVSRLAENRGLRLLDIERPFEKVAEVGGIALPEGSVCPSVMRRMPSTMFACYRVDSRVVSISRGDDERTPLIAIDSPRSEWEPTLSPDGLTLAFVSDRRGAPALYVAQAADGEDLATPAVAVTTRELAMHPELRPRALQWSADGRRIAYVAQGAGRSEGWVLEVQTRQLQRIGSDDERVRSVAFGAGDSLLVASDRDGDWGLWRVQDGNWHSLGIAGGSRAALAPDGALVFTRAGDPRLYRRAGEGVEQTLIDDLWMVDEPAWVAGATELCAVRSHGGAPEHGRRVDCARWNALGDTSEEAAWAPAFSFVDNVLGATFSLSPDLTTMYAAEQLRSEADLYLWSW